jgi:hypothetical protein
MQLCHSATIFMVIGADRNVAWCENGTQINADSRGLSGSAFIRVNPRTNCIFMVIGVADMLPDPEMERR